MGRTLALYSAAQGSPTYHSSCSAGLNLYPEQCLLGTLYKKTEFLVKYLPVLDPVLLVVEVAASHSNFEELGLHMWQQDICCS